MTTKTPTTKKVSKKAVAAAVSLDAIVYSQKGTKASTITLPEKIFGLAWNADLVHQVAVSMMANKRAGTAHTKDRSEVSGGGKKPWKQKGTGRARHGSSRSPIWVGGGVTFGPRSDKDYSKKINKKQRAKALFTVLSKKFADGEMLFVDSLALPEIKTKGAAAVVANLAKIDGFAKMTTKKATGTLVIVPETDDATAKSFNNIPGVTVSMLDGLNTLSAATFKHLVIVSPEAIIASLEQKMK